MGNEGGCSRFCDKTAPIDHNPDDILITEYIVPCQICNRQFKHPELKQHIDLSHYATIQQQQDGNVAVMCLLCLKLTNDLLQHGAHIADKHSYAHPLPTHNHTLDQQVVTQHAKPRKRTEEWQLNQAKKAAVAKLHSDAHFQITRQLEPNRYQASVDGVSYEVVKYSKEYRGADYQPELMQAELVWINVFRQKGKCRYYFVDWEPAQRTILCKALLFIAKNA